MADAPLLVPPVWQELKLVQQLTGQLAAAANRIHDFVAPLLGVRPLGAEEFTDHDLRHSIRVLHRIGQILPSDASLNQPELYLLICSALLHDAGMWTERAEALQLVTDSEFLAYCQTNVPSELREVKRALSSDNRRWMGELGLQRLAASFNRTKHPERLGNVVLKTGPMSTALRTLIGTDFVDAVVLASVAHSWERQRINDDDALRPREIGGVLVNLRYVAELLRLGDLLDLGEGRISSLLWSYLSPLNSESEAHWRKEASLKLERCEPDLIQVAGHFDVDEGGIATAEAYRLACDWLAWLRDEITGAAFVLSARSDEPFKERCRFGRMQLDISRVSVKGLALQGQVAFELDRARVLDLLGERIYSDGCVFVRELLQNAVDATRAQIVRDHRKAVEAGNPEYPSERPWNWPLNVITSDEYMIDVDTRDESVDGQTFKVFSIRDRGTGMTLRQIREHFLQVGRSFYKTSQYVQEFRHPSISEFGIGFISCLNVADRIEVVTRAAGEPAGLRMTLQSPSEYFLVERAADVERGTCVTLWIRTDAPRQPNWDILPIVGQKLRSALGLTGTNGDFGAAARQYGLMLEMKVRVNGTVAPLYRAATLPVRHDAAAGTTVRSRLVTVASPSGRVLGEGKIEFAALSSGIPRFLAESTEKRPAVDFFVSVKGIWIFGQSRRAHTPVAVIDLYRLRAGALTAGRQLSKKKGVRAIGEAAIRQLIKDTYSTFGGADAEMANLWRGVERDAFVSAVLPPRHPCRFKGKLRWMTFAEAVNRFDRFLIVPFAVAWKGLIGDDVACLGAITESYPFHLARCALVETGASVAYLYPPSASVENLTLLSGQSADLMDGLYTWHGSEMPRTPRSGRRATKSFRADGANEPRRTSPWWELGLSSSIATVDSPTAQAVLTELTELSNFQLPSSPLTVTIPDGDDWR